MSIDMYLEDSQSQAASTQKMTQEEIKAYEELERSLTDFEASTESLKGKAYDSARSYSERVLRPLVHGGKLLSEAVGKTVKQFPESYIAQVANESLKESDIEANIQGLTNIIAIQETSIFGVKAVGLSELVKNQQKMIDTLTDARQVLQEKLDKLREFNNSSPQIFSEIENLKNMITTGLNHLNNAWDAKKGVYVLPANLDWATQIMNYTPPSNLQDSQSRDKDFINNLIEQYGYDEDTAKKILKLKEGIDKKYPRMSQKKKDYLLNRSLGAPVYDGYKWDQTAGDLDGDSAQEFYIRMGLTDAESKSLYYEIEKQHYFSNFTTGTIVDPAAEGDAKYTDRLKLYKETHNISGMSDSEIKAAFLNNWKEQNKRYANKTDFAHQFITTATHLNLSLPPGYMMLMFGGREGIEAVSGWRGDATTDAETKPSMGNDDYRADLDAVNITSIMNEKKLSFLEASNYYYRQLEDKTDSKTDKMTRSEFFLKYTDINDVKKEIFKMVPKKFYEGAKDTYTEPTEEEKRAYIKKHYPDSYNFLRSLEERDNQLGNYAERE